MPKRDIDTEVLIAIIRSKPVLWDKTSDVYKDKWGTKGAWEEVCTILNKDFQTKTKKEKEAFLKEVMRRWANVRDSFKKFCKREKELEKNGERIPKRKKYLYHNELKFLRKLYDPENAEEENNEKDALQSDIDKLISSVNLRTWSQDIDTVSNAATESDADGEENVSSAESSTSQSDSVAVDKKKRSDVSELKISKVFGSDKSGRHLSFFKGIIPSLEEFNEQEVLKFQMGVLQLISSISDQKHGAPQTQLPAQFFSFQSQPGPTAYATPYPSGQPVYPAFWPTVCQKCSTETTPQESPSKPIE